MSWIWLLLCSLMVAADDTTHDASRLLQELLAAHNRLEEEQGRLRAMIEAVQPKAAVRYGPQAAASDGGLAAHWQAPVARRLLDEDEIVAVEGMISGLPDGPVKVALQHLATATAHIRTCLDYMWLLLCGALTMFMLLLHVAPALAFLKVTQEKEEQGLDAAALVVGKQAQQISADGQPVLGCLAPGEVAIGLHVKVNESFMSNDKSKKVMIEKGMSGIIEKVDKPKQTLKKKASTVSLGEASSEAEAKDRKGDCPTKPRKQPSPPAPPEFALGA